MRNPRLAPAPGQRAVVRRQPLIFAVTRASDRLQVLLQPTRAGDGRSIPLLAAGSLVVDLVTAEAMRREHLSFPARLGLDLLQGTIWASVVRDDADAVSLAQLPGVLLSTEASLRYGAPGLVVSLVQAGVPALVRRARGHRPRFWLIAWGIVGGAIGLALRTHEHHRQWAEHRERQLVLEARSEAARVAGRNEAAVGQETAIDLLERSAYLIENYFHIPCSRERDLVSQFRERLASATREQGAYLADALLGWQSGHNRHPDLSRAVQLSLDPRDGTILLSKAQVEALYRELDELDARRGMAGKVAVEIVDRREAARPEGARQLRVDGAVVYLPGETARPPYLFEPAPVGFLLQGAWMIVPLLPTYDAVPLALGLTLPVAAVAAAIWASRHLRRGSRSGLVHVLSVSFALALAEALVATTTMRKPYQCSGEMRVPAVLALDGYHVMLGYALPQLTRPQRVIAATGSVFIAAAGMAVSPTPRQPRTFVVRFLRPLAALVAFWGFAADIERETTAEYEETLAAERRVIEAKRSEGSSDVLVLAARVRSALGAHLEEAAAVGVLDGDKADVLAELRRRLLAADQQCDEVRRALFTGGRV